MHTEAFSNCDIQKITWPSGCEIIPYECFRDSKLEEIYNLDDNVTEIHDRAFASNKIQNMDLSRVTNVIIYKHAFRGIERKKIIPPYYITNEALDFAFGD